MSRMLMVAAVVSILCPGSIGAANDDDDRRGFLAGASLGSGAYASGCVGSFCTVNHLFEGRLGRAVTPRVALLVEGTSVGDGLVCVVDPECHAPVGNLLDVGVQIRPSSRTFMRVGAGAGQTPAWRPAFAGGMGFDVRPFQDSSSDVEFELRVSSIHGSAKDILHSPAEPKKGWVNMVSLNVGFTWYERSPRPVPAQVRNHR